MTFINAHRERWGVEPICEVLQVAPSTYYAALSRPASARQLRDAELRTEIGRVHQRNFGVYGVERCGGSYCERALRLAGTGWVGS